VGSGIITASHMAITINIHGEVARLATFLGVRRFDFICMM